MNMYPAGSHINTSVQMTECPTQDNISYMVNVLSQATINIQSTFDNGSKIKQCFFNSFNSCNS